MPRKYRPPESRRRRARKTPSPHIFENPPEDGDAPVDTVKEAVLAESTPVPAPAAAQRLSVAQSSRATVTKHVSRDYSYVRGEIGRIILVAGFLVVSLLITSLLRK